MCVLIVLHHTNPCSCACTCDDVMSWVRCGIMLCHAMPCHATSCSCVHVIPSSEYVHCASCGFESSRLESFLDVALVVRGCASIEAGLTQFVTPGKDMHVCDGAMREPVHALSCGVGCATRESIQNMLSVTHVTWTYDT